MHFSARWSKLLFGLSALGTSVLFFAAWLLLRTPLPAPVGPLGAAGLILIVLVSLLFTVRGYRLEGGIVYVRRLLWETPLDLEGLVAADADPKAMHGAIRTFGNGGLFSISGWFYRKGSGKFRAWVTTMSDAVVLRYRDGRKLVVSPADPTRFAAEVRRRMGLGTS